MLASNSLGPAITPLFVVAIMSVWGWRSVYFALFVPGLVMIVLLWIFVRDKPADSPKLSPQELMEIEGDQTPGSKTAEKTTTIQQILKEKAVWQCFLILFFFDITLWGFMTWLPSYLVKARGFKMMQMGVAASLPFFAGMIGCLLGGWISDKFFSTRRKVPIVATQLLSAFFLYLTFTTKDMMWMVLWQTLAGACIKFFISSFWALPMNTIPKSVMGTAGAFINLAGQIAALVSPLVIGYLVQTAHGGFDSSFQFLIGAALVSCGIVLTLRKQAVEEPQELAVGAK
jgi:sugar phosphate permease